MSQKKNYKKYTDTLIFYSCIVLKYFNPWNLFVNSREKFGCFFYITYSLNYN